MTSRSTANSTTAPAPSKTFARVTASFNTVVLSPFAKVNRTTTANVTTTDGASVEATQASNSSGNGGVEATQASNSTGNAALIGGIVGGVAALLLVGGIVGAVVVSRRRARADKAASVSQSDASSTLQMSRASTMQSYSEPGDVRRGNSVQF